MFLLKPKIIPAILVAGFLFTPQAWAFLEDTEARRAILELRQRVQNFEQENAQLRRGLLDLQAEIQNIQTQNAELRGQNEQLARETLQLQEILQKQGASLDERLRVFEPVLVRIDGLEFQTMPAEKQAFENALALMQAGDFANARNAFAAFINQYAGSGYMPSARFWLASTQYAARDYKEAVQNLQSMLRSAPSHSRAPEAMLTLANSQWALKDSKNARKTLQDLIAKYPETDAAKNAQQLLPKIK